MLRIHRFEESAMDIVRRGQGIAGSVHICARLGPPRGP